MSTLTRFWHYWRDNLKEAKERHEMIVLIAFFLVQIAVVGPKLYGISFGKDISAPGGAFAVIEIVSMSITGAWFFLWCPFKRHEDILKKHKEERDNLGKTIDSLSTPALEINCEPQKIPSGRWKIYQLRVENKSRARTAENVQFEILALDYGLQNNEAVFCPPFPIILRGATQGSSAINAGSSMPFNLFRAVVSESLVMEGGSKEYAKQKIITACFTEDILRDVVVFRPDTKYKIKLLATAKDFSKAESEYEMKFEDHENQIRLTLTPI